MSKRVKTGCKTGTGRSWQYEKKHLGLTTSTAQASGTRQKPVNVQPCSWTAQASWSRVSTGFPLKEETSLDRDNGESDHCKKKRGPKGTVGDEARKSTRKTRKVDGEFDAAVPSRRFVWFVGWRLCCACGRFWGHPYFLFSYFSSPCLSLVIILRSTSALFPSRPGPITAILPTTRRPVLRMQYHFTVPVNRTPSRRCLFSFDFISWFFWLCRVSDTL